MKKMITMALVVFSMTVFAQQQEVTTQKPVKKEFSGKHQYKKGKRFHKGDMFLKELNLTEVQKGQIKDIKSKHRVESTELRKKHQSEFQAVLTQEQIQKLDQIKLEKREYRAAFKSQVQKQQQQ